MSDLDDLSDDALVLRYATGDMAVAQTLTVRLVPRCLAFATRMLKGDRSEAEDVTQEAMLRLWRQAPKWDADGAARPSTWLLKVASNLCIDRLRKRAFVDLDAIDTPVDPAPGPLDTLVAQDRVRVLDDALASLPDRQRQAVILRHIEGWPNSEIADTMDITVEAVESLIARAKRSLKAILAPQKEELSDG